MIMCDFENPDCLNCPYPECNASVTDMRRQWRYEKANRKKMEPKKPKTVTVSDTQCSKCIYASPYDVNRLHMICMYAVRAGRCRSLEEGYEKGKCRHFTQGTPTHDDWMRTKQVIFKEGKDG